MTRYRLLGAFTAGLVFAATTQAQDDIFDPTESYRATDDDGNTTRITPSALGGYNSTDSEGNTTRIKPTGFGSRSSYDRTPVDADDRQLTTRLPTTPSGLPRAVSVTLRLRFQVSAFC